MMHKTYLLELIKIVLFKLFEFHNSIKKSKKKLQYPVKYLITHHKLVTTFYKSTCMTV